jgi:hypothetical protein
MRKEATMSATDIQAPHLSAEEWELVGELLQREVRQLPIEIHHTDLRSAREALHRRLETVEALIVKLQPVLGD